MSTSAKIPTLANLTNESPMMETSTRRPNPLASKKKNVDHFCINCTQIDFADDIAQFMLSISAPSLYDLACANFQKEYEHGKYPENYLEMAKQDQVDACVQVPTTSTLTTAPLRTIFCTRLASTMNINETRRCSNFIRKNTNNFHQNVIIFNIASKPCGLDTSHSLWLR
uniref:Uncharacterized protein n=1 Tax=Globodera rostochiensis TaxID=31243 RepID=A0A914H123_GLORO